MLTSARGSATGHPETSAYGRVVGEQTLLPHQPCRLLEPQRRARGRRHAHEAGFFSAAAPCLVGRVQASSAERTAR